MHMHKVCAHQQEEEMMMCKELIAICACTSACAALRAAARAAARAFARVLLPPGGLLGRSGGHSPGAPRTASSCGWSCGAKRGDEAIERSKTKIERSKTKIEGVESRDGVDQRPDRGVRSRPWVAILRRPTTPLWGGG